MTIFDWQTFANQVHQHADAIHEGTELTRAMITHSRAAIGRSKSETRRQNGSLPISTLLHRRPDYFRKRAEELRTKAENCDGSGARALLLKAAQVYDDLAQDATKLQADREAEK